MNNRRRPTGSISILFSILLLILFGFAALAVDIGYMAVAKSELQSAADAGARAGAVRLYNKGVGPDWTTGQQRAEELAEMNRTTGNAVILLSAPEAGYWNATTGGQTIQSPVGFTPTAYDFPAIRVTASRTGVGDGGPITTLFARTLNIDSAPMSASAIAVVSGPGYVDQRNLFPYAMSKCMYETHWDASATPPGPRDSDKEFPLTNDQTAINRYPELRDCPEEEIPGTWTTLKLDANGASAIRDLIKGNVESAPISIGEIIPVDGGLKTTEYGAIQECSKEGDKSCQFVTVPVVSTTVRGDSEVVGFACLEIIRAQQGGKPPLQKTFTVRMTRSCDPPGSGGIGPDYGFKPRPRIVQ